MLYKPRKNEQQEGLRMRIREIANDRPRFGCERIHVMLKREGWQINTSESIACIA